MAESYFTQLGTDLYNMGLIQGIPGKSQPLPVSYYDLYADLLKPTEVIRPFSDLTPPYKLPAAHTDFGKHIMEIYRQDFRFGGEFPEHCCQEAEWRLADTMSDASVRNPRHYSPVILTHQGQPVGLIKDYGENTCYSLVTSKRFGLVEGTFSVPGLTFDFQDVPKAVHAWQIPVRELVGFETIRFGCFMMPRRARRKLESDRTERPALRATHDGLKLQAAKLLQDAQPLISSPEQQVVRRLLAAAATVE